MNMEAFLDKIKKYWFIITALCTVFVGLCTLFVKVGGALNQLDTLSKSIEEIRTDISDQSVFIGKRIDSVDERINSIQEQVYVMAGASPELVGLSMSETYQQSVDNCVATLDSFVLSNASVQYTSVVAYNAEGNELTVEDVAQKKLLIPYKENGKECFFYGQLDKHGNWDGECLINIYKDQKLDLITEAVYDSGDLLSFKQAFPNKTARQDGRDVWFFSRRTMKENFSTGETWDYIRNGDYAQTFTYDSVTVEDILSIDDLQLRVAGWLEGYYNGNTSNGAFNDNSGEAYMVKYFEDGTVRTLYTGKFENGNPEDSTNNAWLIGKNNTASQYFYYNGPVKNGHPTISYNSKNKDLYWKTDQDLIVESAKKFKSDRAIPVPLTGLLDEKDHDTI